MSQQSYDQGKSHEKGERYLSFSLGNEEYAVPFS